MGEQRDIREIREAQAAAEEALDSLNRVEERLKSAGNWGVADLLGGGLISTFMKHSKMDEAEEELENAKAALRRLQRELEDVGASADFHVDVKGFLRFADYFFDDIISDWMVQSKINDAREQVAGAKEQVRLIIADLRRMEQGNL